MRLTGWQVLPLVGALLLGGCERSEPVEFEPPELPTKLWDITPGGRSAEFPSQRGIAVEPAVLKALDVGALVELTLPKTGIGPQTPSLDIASIDRKHQMLKGEVEVLVGSVDGGTQLDHITLSRGQKETYGTVAKGGAIYEVVINNETGQGRIVDEADLTRGRELEDDVIEVPLDGH